MTRTQIISTTVILVAIGLTVWYLRQPGQPEPIFTSDTSSETPSAALPQNVRLKTTEIEGVGGQYQFSAEIPRDWEAKWVTETDAINLFDPALEAESDLDRSQIFIRSFEATQFLTLQTVIIYNQDEVELGGRPTVRYEIEKRPNVAPFADQPRWRSERHIVTDVRVSDTSPSVFYVIAKRPDLDQDVYDHFLATLDLDDTATQSLRATEPTDGFLDRITKKPFGIRIDPETSPVQPERFTGYHTGVDAEYVDVTEDVEVRAVADGLVQRASTVDGYGGVIVVDHTINGERYQVVYGHLDPSSLPSAAQTLRQGEVIGRLGEGGSSETDGERKHLHLGFFKGETIDLRGYVSSQAELTQWVDPVLLLES